MTLELPSLSSSALTSVLLLGALSWVASACSSDPEPAGPGSAGSSGNGGTAPIAGGGAGGAGGGMAGAAGKASAGSSGAGASAGGAGGTGGAGGSGGGNGGSGGAATKSKMTFFLSGSPVPMGANFGGLAGADAHCQMLATAADGGDHTWHAYLSASGPPAVNARDRIGTGPWVNANGVTVATSVADLHSANNMLGKANSVDENGQPVNGTGDDPVRHDILTGSTADGAAYPAGDDHTCDDWTSSGAGAARVGHHDKQGGGEAPMSWNSAHDSQGCSLQNLRDTGGDGRIYCFAID